MEDWETNDFTKFPWEHWGTKPWGITSSSPWEGLYCAASPAMDDYQSAILQVVYTAGTDDSISFYRRVSSEPNFDFLHFYIDDILQGSWSGEAIWGRVVCPVTAGTHTFKWIYVKDIFMSMGLDKAWIDYIEFPPPVLPDVQVGPNDSTCAGDPYQLTATANGYDNLKWFTNGDGTFTTDTILEPIYTPGAQDIIDGEVKLMLRAFVQYGSSLNSMVLTIRNGPVASITIDPKDTLCSWQSGILSTEFTSGATYLWTPGEFTTPSIEIDTAVAGGLGTTTFNVVVTGLLTVVPAPIRLTSPLRIARPSMTCKGDSILPSLPIRQMACSICGFTLQNRRRSPSEYDPPLISSWLKRESFRLMEHSSGILTSGIWHPGSIFWRLNGNRKRLRRK